MLEKGLVQIYTGDGKGKTTAALGILLRAWGHGLRPCVIQFIKRENDNLGELKAARQLGVANGTRWEMDSPGVLQICLKVAQQRNVPRIRVCQHHQVQRTIPKV